MRHEISPPVLSSSQLPNARAFPIYVPLLAPTFFSRDHQGSRPIYDARHVEQHRRGAGNQKEGHKQTTKPNQKEDIAHETANNWWGN